MVAGEVVAVAVAVVKATAVTGAVAASQAVVAVGPGERASGMAVMEGTA